MAHRTLPAVLQRLLVDHSHDELSDATLLERFVLHRDEEAFAAIFRRHGAMVKGVARRRLGLSAEVDDVVQATFLILAQNARRIRRHGSLAAWLHGVARRVAGRLAAQAARRPELRPDLHPPARSEPDRPLDAELDAEVSGLPDRLRQPIVLCYLEGQTVDEAARRLGWPRGSVAGYLARGKELLRQRLVRRGWAPAALAALETGSAEAAPALPSLLTSQALALLAGRSDLIPPALLSLVHGATPAMTAAPWPIAALCLVFIGTASAGWAWSALRTESGPVPGPAKPAVTVVALEREHAVQEDEPWLRFYDGKQTFLVSLDGKKRREVPTKRLAYHPDTLRMLSDMMLPDAGPDVAFSPDRSRIAWIGSFGPDGSARPHPFHGHVIVSQPDGSDPKRLTDTEASRSRIVWSPDNRWLAWEESSGDGFMVKVMELRSGLIPFSFGGPNASTRMPIWSNQSVLLYAVEKGRDGKMPTVDLVARILDGVMSSDALRPRTVAEKLVVMGFAMDPAGERLAYSTLEEMVVKNIQEAGVEGWRINELRKIAPEA
ncbi:MAG TPA: sigma-70 family RNA polymerase sigma factor, partial [Gemmatales bacterium]|nr:sigma-70 family RNA polymerase sigma factor [Gemmatales bacterium]